MSIEENIINNIWKKEHEKILTDWADKAMCYKWLHIRSHKKYSRINTWFTIPVIIMSTVTGAANFAQDRFSSNMKQYVPMIIGSINIFAGIITTIQQFLKITEFNEKHRISAISWDKFYRNIRLELSRAPTERMDVSQMLKICTQEYDRLMETSPVIKDSVVNEFKKTFLNNKKKKITSCCNNSNTIILPTEEILRRRKAYIEISKPDICDSLISTIHFLYKSEEEGDNNQDNDQVDDNSENEFEQKQIIFNNFKNSFFELHNRYPEINEYIKSLENNIDRETIDILINL